MATVKVGMADLNICRAPDMITTLGLGSCIGIAVYDPVLKIGGLAHIMLPDSTQMRNNSNIAKFADTGIEELIKRVTAAGANRRRLVAKIAGGATMFTTTSEKFNIGSRNVEAVKRVLMENRIPIMSEDTGLDYGRTQLFYPESGIMEIRAAAKGTKLF